jgi:hypothetical protein
MLEKAGAHAGRVFPSRVLLLALGAILLGLAFWIHFTRGLKVHVYNADSQTLRSLVVSVTGNSYHLGDLLPGSTVSVLVEPKGESGVTVEFVDVGGSLKQFNAAGYYESGYKGTIFLEINAERILQKREKVTNGL